MRWKSLYPFLVRGSATALSLYALLPENVVSEVATGDAIYVFEGE
jgi:hypothetical protein